MLFWIFVIMLAVGVLFWILNRLSYSKDQSNTSGFWKLMYSNFMDYASIVLTTFSAMFLVIALIVITCIRFVSSDALYAANMERYEALLYKVEENDIRDEFGIINKNYIDEIQEWNEDVVKNKAYANNFWVGVFYPDWIDELQTIDLKRFRIKEKGAN